MFGSTEAAAQSVTRIEEDASFGSHYADRKCSVQQPLQIACANARQLEAREVKAGGLLSKGSRRVAPDGAARASSESTGCNFYLISSTGAGRLQATLEMSRAVLRASGAELQRAAEVSDGVS